eukprot:TRINITY_DN6428_c0_g1_i2.p1 TRINITY_DN6428_c0_g1~~TRINITY_DN6428_c0_g1_i2.p1  ORF type:complete len:1282 (+),score=318.03 TRINITY_DN6428_c0_g1_i2:45-3890(+)
MPQEQQAAKAAAKTATLKIERTLHVPLIGAGGAGIRKITADTGAKVRFPAQQEQSDEVHISGSHEQIEAAKKMLLESAAVLRRNRVERATEERLEVDRSLHGAVVGPVGLNITRIRDETGVNVFVPRRGVEEDFITLRGAPAQIVKAKEILAEILKEAAATRVLTEEMRVEKHMHPYIIGKQGAFVRDIRDRTGVQVNIPPKDTDLSIITLRGTGDAIKKAKMMILEKLNDESGTNTGPIITETITVERSLHSWLIGKAGASIKRIRDETGVQINLPSREAASDEIVLKGTEENVEKAKRLIQKRVRAGMDDRDAVVEEVPFDKQLSAAIIGKGGETIRKLRDETGCSFFIPDAHSESSSIAIRGAAEDVARAKAIIEEKLAVAKGERQEKGAFVCPGFFDGRCHDGSDCTKGSHPPVCWMFNTPDGCPVQGVRAAVGQLFPRCPFGYHMTRTPESPKPEKLLWECSSAKADPVKRRWREGGGNPDLIEAVYQIKNPHREWLFENTRCEMTQNYNARPDMLEGFHGTAAVNIMSIASQGFSKRCRKVMVYGEGDYFAKDPRVSIGYCKGDSYMFLCRILLGKQRKTDKEEGDHIWVPDCRYYVIANGDQVLPLYVIKFRNPYSKMAEMETQIYERRATKKEAKSKFKGMGELRLCASCENELPRKEFIGAEWENPDNKLRMCKLCTEFHTAPDPVAPFLTNKLDDLDSDLRDKQTGAREPGKYHRKCEMVAETTTKLWLGYLEPSMTDDELRFDVVDFLGEYEIDRDDIRFEKEGLRRAARVTLLKPITRMEVLELNMRPYHEKYTICVDDVQPNNPARKGKLCKRLTGINKFCRWQNIRFVDAACDFEHPAEADPTHNAEYWLEEIKPSTAKFEEIKSHFLQGANIRGGRVTVQSIRRIHNDVLNAQFERRKDFQNKKHGTDGGELELWHGTNCNILAHIYQNGLRCPSDMQASPSCPVSGGKGLSTSLCNNDCAHCTTPHQWRHCHMYGLGIYLADLSGKSHRYVSAPVVADPDPEKEHTGEIYKMIRCRVHLGNPYLVDGLLATPDAMHDHFLPFPADETKLNRMGRDEELSHTGHDSYFVRGHGASFVQNRSVAHSEYICFTPWQVLPLYEVAYTVGKPTAKVLAALDADTEKMRKHAEAVMQARVKAKRDAEREQQREKRLRPTQVDQAKEERAELESALGKEQKRLSQWQKELFCDLDNDRLRDKIDALKEKIKDMELEIALLTKEITVLEVKAASPTSRAAPQWAAKKEKTKVEIKRCPCPRNENGQVICSCFV